MSSLWNKLHYGWRYFITSIFLIGAGVLYLKVISPKFGIHIPCLFKEVTGYECAGCGVTRASLSLLDGDWYQAFRYNMLVFILAPLFILMFILEKVGRKKASSYLTWFMLGVAVLFMVLRNIDMFSWLAPTSIR